MVLQKQDGGIRPILCGEVWRRCFASLAFYENFDTSDPNDSDVIIKIDVSNAFNTTDRALTLDIISGRASRDYACGLKRGDVIPTVDTLTHLFGYFQAMRTCHSKLQYFDWDGQVHLVKR